MGRREVLLWRSGQRKNCDLGCAYCSLHRSHIGSLTASTQTHNVALASSVADFVVSVGGDGRILSQGTISDALKSNKKLVEELRHDEELIKESETEINAGPSITPGDSALGKLILAEEEQEGRISWSTRELGYLVSAALFKHSRCSEDVLQIAGWG